MDEAHSMNASASPRTIYLMWKAHTSIRILIDHFGRGGGVTLAQYTVLSLLHGRDNLSSADVARRLGVSPQSINETIASLTAAGFVEKRQVGANRKVLRLRLTPAGCAHLRQAERAIDIAEADMFEGFSATQIDSLRRMLSQLLAKAQAVQAGAQAIAHPS